MRRWVDARLAGSYGCRAMSLRRLIALVAALFMVAFMLSLVLATTGRTRSSDSRARFTTAQVAACEASRVHYERFRGPSPAVKTLPWIVAEPHSVGLVGHLFYYDAHNPWATHHRSGWRIYAGGKSPDKRLNMKILWTAPSPVSDAPSLLVRGKRLVRPSHFSQLLHVGPSILKVPRAGCWRLTLHAGPAVTYLTVLAVAP
jgi:hypothetical protein